MPPNDRVDHPSEGGSYIRHPDGTCELKERGKTDALVNGHPDQERLVIDEAAKAEASIAPKATRSQRSDA